MQEESKPFRITVEHWDDRVSIERDHSDITFDEYIEMLKRVSAAVFTQELWDEYFGE